MKEFIDELLGKYNPDPDFELWVRAWMAYHQATDRVDGHIIQPRSKEEYELRRRAIRAGEYAMSEVFDDQHYKMDERRGNISLKAKLEALRRLKKG